MAIGDPYATLTQLKARLDITDTTDDARLTDALDSATREIEDWCERQFNDAGAASSRTYTPGSYDLLRLDDFSTTTGLIVTTDTGGDGTYATTWATTDYQLEPLNGVVRGRTGWPYNRIRAIGSYRFPCSGSGRTTVQVTARWGWAAVPAPVVEACLILAAETFKAGDAPFGVAGFGEFGAVRVRANPLAQAKLAPYRRNPVLVA